LKVIGGICALLLVGYLFSTCYRKFKIDSQAEGIASDWAIALLIFPGSVLLLFLMIVLLV